MRRVPLWSAQSSASAIFAIEILTDSHSEEGSLEVAGRSSGGGVVHSSVEVHCNIPVVVGSHAADPVQGRTT